MSVRVVAMLLLVGAVIASAVGVVYARHESRRHFVELNRLSVERDNLNFEFGRLQLEQATWAENSRYRTDRTWSSRHGVAGAAEWSSQIGDGQ